MEEYVFLSRALDKGAKIIRAFRRTNRRGSELRRSVAVVLDGIATTYVNGYADVGWNDIKRRAKADGAEIRIKRIRDLKVALV